MTSYLTMGTILTNLPALKRVQCSSKVKVQIFPLLEEVSMTATKLQVAADANWNNCAGKLVRICYITFNICKQPVIVGHSLIDFSGA